jgi:hypothetical protein
MQFQLIKASRQAPELDPLEVYDEENPPALVWVCECVAESIGGYQPTIERGSLDGYGAPAGCLYVPAPPAPIEPAEVGFAWTRATPTLEVYGWEQTPIIIEIPFAVSMAQFREELSKPEHAVEGVTLRAMVQQAIEGAGIVMQDWWHTSSIVERNDLKVLGMAQALGVTPEQLDAVFVGAELN